MKLRNKKTGEIIDFAKSDYLYSKCKGIYLANNDGTYLWYYSLADFCEEWEDVPEEPKGYWYIRDGGNIDHNLYGKSIINRHKEIGNYFETREEAEKAVEKLKAWKRLKDKKIFIWLYHFDYRSQDGSFNVEFEDNLSSDELKQVDDDLDLLVGGEE